jgi:hypothetical protein
MFHPPTPTPLVPPLPVLTFIRWNVENVRGCEKAGRCNFFNKVDFLLMKGPAHLKILLHYWASEGPTCRGSQARGTKKMPCRFPPQSSKLFSLPGVDTLRDNIINISSHECIMPETKKSMQGCH